MPRSGHSFTINVTAVSYTHLDVYKRQGVTFTWMATDHFGVELLAATPFRHKVGLGPTGTLSLIHI